MHRRPALPAIAAVLIALAGLQSSPLRAAENPHEQLQVAEVFTGDLPEGNTGQT